ncbi:hypothetical protein P689_12316 [Candidatus Riesia pediculischaeffi PTSU]|uniref:Uncharacterized protein n=1 Tax=Candidatus Riesia pediculischaeffi PTSU TaxID=1401651 RepID=A0A0C1S171_9ENTR|nr:hypothetical protein P689_12316 [Candidatus Riesia pediculischaeffi PTSU]
MLPLTPINIFLFCKLFIIYLRNKIIFRTLNKLHRRILHCTFV